MLLPLEDVGDGLGISFCQVRLLGNVYSLMAFIRNDVFLYGLFHVYC